MNKLATLMALIAIAMFGFVSPSLADTVDVFDDPCGDAAPQGVDIDTLTVTSDGNAMTITVRIDTCFNLVNAKYRVHFDTTGTDTLSNTNCETRHRTLRSCGA